MRYKINLQAQKREKQVPEEKTVERA